MSRIRYTASKDAAGFSCSLIVVYDHAGQVVEALSETEAARYSRHSYEPIIEGGRLTHEAYNRLSHRGTCLLSAVLHAGRVS